MSIIEIITAFRQRLLVILREFAYKIGQMLVPLEATEFFDALEQGVMKKTNDIIGIESLTEKVEEIVARELSLVVNQIAESLQIDPNSITTDGLT